MGGGALIINFFPRPTFFSFLPPPPPPPKYSLYMYIVCISVVGVSSGLLMTDLIIGNIPWQAETACATTMCVVSICSIVQDVISRDIAH